MWGATRRLERKLRSFPDFNPRSPCGERRSGDGAFDCAVQISIHAPRVGSDRSGLFHRPSDIYFNPRSPCGERPAKQNLILYYLTIFQSTLPVWGATRIHDADQCHAEHFNPRSPCGERQHPSAGGYCPRQFQSTLPVWGATRRYSNGG